MKQKTRKELERENKQLAKENCILREAVRGIARFAVPIDDKMRELLAKELEMDLGADYYAAASGYMAGTAKMALRILGYHETDQKLFRRMSFPDADVVF